jgi:hypothetical protein
MVALALVSPHEAFDLFLAFALFGLVLCGWLKLDRREKRRREVRRERQARYSAECRRTIEERDEAQRYLGGVAR